MENKLRLAVLWIAGVFPDGPCQRWCSEDPTDTLQIRLWGCWSIVVWWTKVDISQSFPFHSYSRGSRVTTKDKDVTFFLFSSETSLFSIGQLPVQNCSGVALAAGQWMQSSPVYKHQRGFSGRGCCGTFLLICVTSRNIKLSHWNLPLVFCSWRFYSYKTNLVICPLCISREKGENVELLPCLYLWMFLLV